MLFGGTLSAQEYKIPVQNIKDGRLVLKDFNGELPLEGYSGSDIIITADSDDFTPPEKAKGLKAVYPGGTDNSGIGLDVKKDGNQITIISLIPFSKKAGYKMKVPDNLAIDIKSSCERSNSISVSDMKNEIDINNCHNIDLKNVSGPLVLTTISGNINVTFGTINASGKPFSIVSISGDVDVTLPAKTAADIELRTVSGSIYSDFDFSNTQKDLKKVGGNVLSLPLNGGGFSFSLGTVSGNIYLRKGN